MQVKQHHLPRKGLFKLTRRGRNQATKPALSSKVNLCPLALWGGNLWPPPWPLLPLLLTNPRPAFPRPGTYPWPGDGDKALARTPPHPTLVASAPPLLVQSPKATLGKGHRSSWTELGKLTTAINDLPRVTAVGKERKTRNGMKRWGRKTFPCHPWGDRKGGGGQSQAGCLYKLWKAWGTQSMGGNEILCLVRADFFFNDKVITGVFTLR